MTAVAAIGAKCQLCGVAIKLNDHVVLHDRYLGGWQHVDCGDPQRVKEQKRLNTLYYRDLGGEA